jgi:arsenate reductase-like glutaredoxin family protein
MNKNLSTQMSELRNILANIENKSLTEGEAGKIGKEFIDIVLGQTSKEMVKKITAELGTKFEVSYVTKVGNETSKRTRRVKYEFEHRPNTNTYEIVSINGKPQTSRIIVDVEDVVKDMEKSVKLGGKITKIDVEAAAAKDVITPPKSSDTPSQEVVKRAEGMSIDQLEAALKLPAEQLPVMTRKAYEAELAKKKAALPKVDTTPSIKPETPTEEMARRAKGMKDAELENAIIAGKGTQAQLKAYRDELQGRGIALPKSAETPPAKVELDPITKKSDEALEKAIAKKEAEKAEEEATKKLNSGESVVKDATPKVGETPADAVKRELRDKYVDKADDLTKSGRWARFWNWIAENPKTSILTAALVALAGYASYLSMTDDEAQELDNDGDKTGDATTGDKTGDATTGDKTGDATTGDKTGDATTVDKNQAQKTTSSATAGTDGQGIATAEQSSELAKLKAQIDALIAELSKSKDPEIIKRLAVVRERLGQQAAKTSTSEKGSWRDIGNDYERWIGPDGVDADGTVVKRNQLRMVPIDTSQEDEYSKLSRQELLRRARINGRQQAAKQPAVTNESDNELQRWLQIARGK